MQPIYTLNARDNVLLELTRDYHGLTGPEVRAQIQDHFSAAHRILELKEVGYSKLKSALVPKTDRHEAGFVFESKLVESSWYGIEIMSRILPLLDKRTPHSVLSGDLVGDDQQFIFSILECYLQPSRSFTFEHGTLLYCVYINNLTDTAICHLHERLADFSAYIGLFPATVASPAKTYLSSILVNRFLKVGQKTISAHEDDRPNGENINLIGYPFEEYGYEHLSLQSRYFGVFLTYKIERAVSGTFEVDTEMALNAISDQVLPLRGFKILLEAAKYSYLQEQKTGSLLNAGILDLSREQLASLIRSKIAASYIYNLEFKKEYAVVKFDLILEVERQDSSGYPARLSATLEYRPETRKLRVITLY